MQYILIDENDGIFGPYSNVEKVDNGYICDGISLQTIPTGPVVLSEVPDDYTIPTATLETVVTDAPVEPVIADIPVEPTIEGAV